MPFQENLRHYREKAGYAQAKDFAAFLGIKYTTYIAYENQGREPKYDTLRLIAATLNVSIDTLLGFSGVDRYEEYKRLVAEAGYTVEEDGDGYITITRAPDTKRISKSDFFRCVHQTLEKLDSNLTGIRIAYICNAMNELFHSPDSE